MPKLNLKRILILLSDNFGTADLGSNTASNKIGHRVSDRPQTEYVGVHVLQNVFCKE